MMGDNLGSLPAWGPDDTVTVVIETPKGSRNKYSYDPSVGAMRLKMVLPEGMLFPYDFGFIPSTKAEDGDPIDVLVLLDAPVIAGCVIEARLIGVLEAEQREKDESDWTRNDRLVAVATHARTQVDVNGFGDLRAALPDEIESFFGTYNALMGRDFRIVGRGDTAAARRLVERAASG
jgi:inorganic pyrophosphatase